MNRIEEFLNNLDTKNMVMLYASVAILIFIIYYNFNYSVLQGQITNNNRQIVMLRKKLSKKKNLERQLISLKKRVKILQKENIGLQEDLKYLKLLINTSEILNINEKKFIGILKNILQKATDNGILASYEFTKIIDNYKQYVIVIKGSFDNNNVRSFYNFIKNLEAIKAIKYIKQLNIKIDEKKQIKFNIQIVFWSL